MQLKQFFIKLLLLFMLTWGLIEVFFYFDPYQKYNLETSYNAVIIDKYKRLQATPSPKIVLIAGSNFAYGVNSKLIEDSLQKPVVNMAIHYAYGTKFMLKQLSSELKKGDVVLMGFEYIIESSGEKSEQLSMARYFPKAKQWIEFDDILEEIRENSQLKISNLKAVLLRLVQNNQVIPQISDTNSVFFRKSINQYGDLISHHNNVPMKQIPRAILSEHSSMKPAIVDMNVFSKIMRAKGVKVYSVYPTYSKTNYDLDKPIIHKFEKEFQQYAQFIVLGRPTDFVFADSLYHDMAYHLSQKGGDIRTQKIIQLLKN